MAKYTALDGKKLCLKNTNPASAGFVGCICRWNLKHAMRMAGHKKQHGDRQHGVGA